VTSAALQLLRLVAVSIVAGSLVPLQFSLGAHLSDERSTFARFAHDHRGIKEPLVQEARLAKRGPSVYSRCRHSVQFR
jgi:hypothetical protein